MWGLLRPEPCCRPWAPDSPTARLFEASHARLPGGARGRDFLVDGDWEIAAGLFARFFGVCGVAAGYLPGRWRRGIVSTGLCMFPQIR